MNVITESYNINFNAKRIKYTQEQLCNTLMPMLDAELSIKDIMKHTNISRRTIEDWSLNTLGKTIPKYYRDKRYLKLQNEITEYKEAGLTDKEIGSIYGHHNTWVNKIIQKMKIGRRTVDINKDLADNAPDMIYKGYPVHIIANRLNISENTVNKWIYKTFKKTIKQIRKENNIPIKKEYSGNNLKIKLNEYLVVKGLSMSETSKLLNLPKQRVIYWMKTFNISSWKQTAHKYMEEHITEMINIGMTIDEMAKNIGLSISTIKRYIKTVKGKNYTEIKREKSHKLS